MKILTVELFTCYKSLFLFTNIRLGHKNTFHNFYNFCTLHDCFINAIKFGRTIFWLSIVYAIGSGINMMSAIKPIGGDNLAVHA